MGFDLHGNNPKMNMKPEELTVYGKYSKMDYKERWQILDANTQLREEYFSQQNEYEESNPGVYFRNNVWWWRPLWSFVCEHCDDILDEEDMESGHYNDCRDISEDKAMRIGIELTCMLDDGRVQEYADLYKKEVDSMPQVDCYICNNNNYGNHKKRECKSCNKTGLKDDWAKSYPFDVDNVRRFAEFCLESGGFSIC